VLAFLPAKLLELEPVGAARLLLGPVIPGPAIGAFEPNVFPHDELPSGSEARRCGCRNQWTTGIRISHPGAPTKADSPRRPARGLPTVGARNHSTILVTTPEPTVLPPSRMAKRRLSSMAIGDSGRSSTFTLMFSPGMHISALPPSAPTSSVIEPVTSVVRK